MSYTANRHLEPSDAARYLCDGFSAEEARALQHHFVWCRECDSVLDQSDLEFTLAKLTGQPVRPAEAECISYLIREIHALRDMGKRKEGRN